MKRFLIILPLFIFIGASGQRSQFDIKKHLEEKQMRSTPVIKTPNSPDEDFLNFMRKDKFNTSAIVLSAKAARLSHTLPNGNKVYLLPQDNMPCIITDMSQFTMRNIAFDKKKESCFFRMPNASPPMQLIPGNNKK